MRIAIDARPLHWPGIGRYIRELVNQLMELEQSIEFYIIINQEDHARFFTGPGKAPILKIVHSKVHTLSEQVELPRWLQKNHIDLFHSPSSLVAPFWTPCPMVLTVHDLLFKSHPEFLNTIIARGYFKLIHDRAVSQSARIITVSEFTRKELEQFHPGAGDKTRTVYNGIAEAFDGQMERGLVEEFKQKTAVRSFYFLAVGSLKRHKNFATLLQGFSKLKAQTVVPVQLVILVKRDLRNPDKSIAGLVDKLCLSEHVIFLDNLSEAELAAAYVGAEAFISTSLYEGFGLPVAEAMASGVPVIVSDIDVFREVTGGNALYVDPCSATSVACAMQQVLDDQDGCQKIVNAAFEQSRMFSWRAAAAKTLAVYREVIDT